MKFDKHQPSRQLQPYIRYFVVSENALESSYKVFPSTGLVIGFQYKGQLSTLGDSGESKLTPAGVTGISDSYKVFRNSADIGSILVYFTETGFAKFVSQPVNELFNLSVSLDSIFAREKVAEVEERLAVANSDKQRIKIVDQFLLSQLKNVETDVRIVEAVRLIHASKGTIRIKEVHEKLFVSASAFEKSFRKIVGTTPKKFASIVRFDAVVADMRDAKSLTKICYENNFFDQAHFIKDFKQFTGDSPQNFKRRS